MTNTEMAWNKGPMLKSIEGGKAKTGGSQPPSHAWLRDRVQGEVFLFHKKSESTSKLESFQVLHLWPDVVLLFRNETPDVPMEYPTSRCTYEYHDIDKFSQQNVYITTLHVPEKQEEKEQQHDEHHRTD